MKFEVLQRQMAARPVFRLQDLHRGRAPAPHEVVQLSHWVRGKRVLRLKKGLYTLAPAYRTGRPADRSGELSALTVAEPLYRPSYLSLHWALSRYGLIPEAAGVLTSVTTLKTARFQNALGSFNYQHVQPKYYFGFLRQPGYWMAEPEKALLDFIYLGIPRAQALTEALFREGYRLQNLHVVNKKRLQELLARFKSPRVQQGGQILLKLLGRQGGRHD